jgi:formylglycine-generating enzyme required for sulfatase activity
MRFHSFFLFFILVTVSIASGQDPTLTKAILKNANDAEAKAKKEAAAKAAAKKGTIKRQVKFNDDDDSKNEADIINADNSFANLVLKSNKGSSITVNINDKESGKIKAGGNKKIPINKNDYFIIFLKDSYGNNYDTAFVVEDKDAKKNIIVTFPEVDYGAIRAEEQRIKKEQDGAEKMLKDEEFRKLREAKLEELRIKKELDDAEKMLKDEELRKIREAKLEELRFKKEEEDALRLQREEELRRIRELNEALRQEHIATLTDTEAILKDQLKNHVADKSTLQALIDNVKKGEIQFDATITDTYDKFKANKESFAESIKTYTDSANAYNLKDKKDNFLKEIKPDFDKILADNFAYFITGVQTGKVSSSSNVQIAFKASRANDIKFFIAKDSLDEAVITGKRPLAYALEVKSDASVFRYLFQNGVDPTNYGTRFPENKNIYATPLAFAAINGDVDVIKLFIEYKAQFYPTGFTKLERKEQAKFLLTKFGDKADVLAVLKDNNYDLDDGSAAIAEALAFLDSTMILVEGAPYTMGCTDEQVSECAGDERPAIKVTVNVFYMCKYEVTQKVWSSLMDDDNPSAFKDCPTCPVETVTWSNVQLFIDRLNKFSGKKYRLPYEVEWEFAARGGKTTTTIKNFLYAGSNDVTEVGFYKSNAIKSQPVGSKKPNVLGIFDLSGNVSEWCNDFYAEDYYAHSSLVNPHGPEVGALKVVRGGSLTQDAWGLRVSNREGDNPETYRKNFLGFRLVLDK